MKDQITQSLESIDFMSIEQEVNFGSHKARQYQCHDTLLEAMKAQSAANLRIVNEIIEKADAFDKQYKPKTSNKNKKKK